MAKVLSVKQPWASWICPSDAIKKAWNDELWPKLPRVVENRTWAKLPNYRGPLLIHASKSIDNKAWEYFDAMKKYVGGESEYPLGCIIGSVELVEIEFSSMSEWYNPGCIALILEENKRFDNFIFIGGQLGLFNVDDNLLTKGSKVEDVPKYGKGWRDGGYVDEKGKMIIVAQQNDELYGIYRVTKFDGDMPVETRKVRGTNVSRNRSEVEKALQVLAKDRRWPEYRPIGDESENEAQHTENCQTDTAPCEAGQAETEAPDDQETELRNAEDLPTEKIIQVKVEPTEGEKKLRRMLCDVERLEEEKRRNAKNYTDEINDLRNKIFELAHDPSYTHKKCKIEWDWVDGVKRYIDPDDGAIVETEAITDDERYQQTQLNLQGRGKDLDESNPQADLESTDHPEYDPIEDIMDDTDENPDFDSFE